MVIVSVWIPKKLMTKAKTYGINISEVLRRALEEEIIRIESKKIGALIDEFKKRVRNIKKEHIVRAVRESREER